MTERIATYHILKTLGEGGFGVVYHAQHEDTGVQVALKTVRVPHRGMLTSIRREIQALASLDHPGVVRILEHGLHDGLPWYAMELLEHHSLRDTLDLHSKRLPTLAAPLPEEASRAAVSRPTELFVSAEQDALVERSRSRLPHAPSPHTTDTPRAALPKRPFSPQGLPALVQLAEALAYLHAQGVVHRDLKPENVLLQSHGRVVVVDFGLAVHTHGGIGRERMSSTLSAAGTVTYMAPEQIEGAWVDARADLYALGCMLYEVLTGRPPFVEPSPIRIMTRHLNDAPLPPRARVENLPEALDTLCMRLLAKRPEDRPGFAEDIARILAEHLPEPITLSPRARTTHLYRPALAGREVLLSVLHTQHKRLLARAGGCVALIGESGVGKTRLALELIRKAERSLCTVLTGECTHLGDALHPLRNALQAVADRCRSEDEPLEIGREGRILAAYEPSFHALPAVAALPDPPRLPLQEARLRLYAALEAIFDRLAEDRPVLLILDDLQHIDALTLGWLEYLRRSDHDSALLIVALARREELAPELEQFFEEGRVARFEVERLDLEDVGLMVRSMLALESPPEAFVHFLHERSEGNPYFVAEYLRTAVSAGLLERSERGVWTWTDADPCDPNNYSAISLPTALGELLELRLQRLDAHTRAIADAASVLGRESPTSTLAQLLDTHPEDPQLTRALGLLVRREIFEYGKFDTLRFCHAQIREVLYTQLPLPQRQALHSRAAQILAQSPFAELAWSERAAHHAHALEHDAARRCYLTAASHAAERFDLEQARRDYEAFLALEDTPAHDRVVTCNRLIQVLLDMGETRAALEHAERNTTRAQALHLEDEAQAALFHLASALRILGRDKDAFDVLDRTRESPRCLALRGAMLRDLGRFEDALRTFERALDTARSQGDRRQEGITLVRLGAVHHVQGRFDQAIQCYREALRAHRDVGHLREEGITLGNIALCYQELGEIDRAGELLEHALEIHREVGNSVSEAITLSNLANGYLRISELNDAQRTLERAVVMHRAAGNRRHEAVALSNLGHCLLDLGQLEASLATLEHALQLHRDLGDRRFEAYTLAQLASLTRRQDLLEPCEEHLRAAEHIFQQGFDDPYCDAITTCERGHLEIACQRDATPHLQRAQKLAHDLGVAAESELGQALARLEVAQQCARAGKPLWRGECVEGLTPALKALATEGRRPM